MAACEAGTPALTWRDRVASDRSENRRRDRKIGQKKRRRTFVRFVTFQSPQGARVAGVRDGRYVDLAKTDSTLPWSLKELLAGGPEVMRRAAAALSKGATFDPGTVRLLAPIPEPQKVICVGLNYADHARESGMEPPPEPVIFNKFPTAVAAHQDVIPLPGESHEVDYEAELVVVINRRARRIAAADAMNYVGGYCVGNDVSARDWQAHKPGKQWLLGKTFDSFAPFGPELVTPDEVGDVGHLRIQCRVNGRTLQDSNTDQLIFSVPRLIAYISQVCTLVPGDVIFTGTPPGVGFARQPPIFLQPGDVAEVEIERLGLLRNSFVADAK
jgi:2-keto-4-pentenoate hydratase/2-oxohepta-3-ene-1,7-dioic acid hydratase in catechol pathway